MELPTVFVLAVVASSLSLIACQPNVDDNEVSVNAVEEPFRTWDNGYKCPSPDGHFPHPKSCEFFYSCEFGVATVMHCKRGYFFDTKARRCSDSRGDVRCFIDKAENKEKEPLRTWDYGYKCPSLYGHFPHPKSCEYFYTCVFGIATLMHCNKGYLFDINNRQCLDSRKVKCHIKGDKDEDKDIGEKVTNNFICPAIYGRYPHPKSCEYFFECRFSIPTLIRCNKGYLYDSEKEQCRESKKVKCRLGKDKEEKNYKEIIDDNRVKNFKCPYIWGTFAHPWDCAQYVVCLYSVPKWFRCNHGSLYDDKIRKCLPSKKVKCGSRWRPDELRTLRPVTVTTPMVPTVTEEITTTEDPNRFICPFPDDRFADPADCSRYYDCDKTVPYLRECSGDTLYDERTQKCLDRKLVKCGNRPGGSDDEELEKDIEDIFTCPYTWGTFTHPADCSKYIVCIYDVPTVFSCKKDQLFDAFLRRCIPSEKVDCGDRYNPDDQFTTTTTLPPTTKTTARISTTTTITTTTTSAPTTTSVPTTVDPTKKPNTPPPTDCKEDDLDCIIDDTGDVKKWFDCPQRYGHFPHGSSRQLFIHCDNWHPFVKKCADGTVFSPTFLVCMWDSRRNKI